MIEVDPKIRLLLDPIAALDAPSLNADGPVAIVRGQMGRPDALAPFTTHSSVAEQVIADAPKSGNTAPG